MIALVFIGLILVGYFLDLLSNSALMGLRIAVKAVENRSGESVNVPEVPGVPTLWGIAVGVIGMVLVILAVVIIATAIKQRRGGEM